MFVKLYGPREQIIMYERNHIKCDIEGRNLTF